MKKVTLGGDRVGSGKRMKVDLHGYERSTHNLSKIWRSTMACGTIVPCYVIPVLPGDTFDIDLDLVIKTHPTVGPLFGSYKWQIDAYQAAIRLYQGQLHNNKLGIGNHMGDVKLPQITLKALPQDDVLLDTDLDNASVNPSCILSYLGIRGVGIDITNTLDLAREFCGIPLLMYWDIYKNYYANKQEGMGAVLHANAATGGIPTNVIWDGNVLGTPAAPTPYFSAVNTVIEVPYGGTAPNPDAVLFNIAGLERISFRELVIDIVDNGPGLQGLVGTFNWAKYGLRQVTSWEMAVPGDLPATKPEIWMFDLEDIDTMRERILAHAVNSTPFNVNAQNLEPYSLVLGSDGAYNNMMGNQEGLGLKTYQSDMFQNWVDTEWIDGTNGISEVTSIDTSGGSFTMDTLNISKKVYNMLMRVAVSGGSYDDWVEVTYDTQPFGRAESPVYMGGLSKELVFQEVVSTAEAEGTNGTQALGTLAGKGVMSGKHKGGRVTVKASEPGYIMILVSGTPRLDYSQGNAWHIDLATMDDFHKAALDEIGFQDSLNMGRAWWSRQYKAPGQWEDTAAGKVPAWLNYMTDINTVHGNFAIGNENIVGEQFMVLTRRYERETIIADGIKDLTTYVDPSKFNHIFATTSLDSQNFWVQIAMDITARRKMSGKMMPNI